MSPRDDLKVHATIPESHYDILESQCYPNVCTIRHKDGLISSNPVSMLWDGEYVRFSTTKDRVKYKNLLADSRLTLIIQAVDDPLYYIEIRGHAEMEDDTDRSFINAIGKKYMDVDEYPFDTPDKQRVTVTVIPEQVSVPNVYGKDGKRPEGGRSTGA